MEPRLGEARERSAHETPAHPLSPGAWQEVDRVDLTDPSWIHVTIAVRRVPNETKQSPASVCDQHPVAAVIGLGQRAFPSTDPLGRVKPVKVGLRQQATIGTLPGPHVHHCDLRRVFDARSPDDRAAHPPSVISRWLRRAGSGQDWGEVLVLELDWATCAASPLARPAARVGMNTSQPDAPVTGRAVTVATCGLGMRPVSRLVGLQDEKQEAQEAPPVRDFVGEQLARGIRRDGWLADDRYPEAGRGEGVGHRM
jgi:hypothetical protein